MIEALSFVGKIQFLRIRNQQDNANITLLIYFDWLIVNKVYLVGIKSNEQQINQTRTKDGRPTNERPRPRSGNEGQIRNELTTARRHEWGYWQIEKRPRHEGHR